MHHGLVYKCFLTATGKGKADIQGYSCTVSVSANKNFYMKKEIIWELFL